MDRLDTDFLESSKEVLQSSGELASFDSFT